MSPEEVRAHIHPLRMRVLALDSIGLIKAGSALIRLHLLSYAQKGAYRLVLRREAAETHGAGHVEISSFHSLSGIAFMPEARTAAPYLLFMTGWSIAFWPCLNRAKRWQLACSRGVGAGVLPLFRGQGRVDERR